MSLLTELCFILFNVEWLDYSILRPYENNEYACNVPLGTITVLPNLFVPITTLNYHVTATAPPTARHLIHKF